MRGMPWRWLFVTLCVISGCDAEYSLESTGPGDSASATQEVMPGETPQQTSAGRGGLAEIQPRVIVLTSDSIAAGRLSEELLRQAFLVTIREEFGVPVRDEAIGAIVPVGEPDIWVMGLSVSPRQTSQIGGINVTRSGPRGTGAWGKPLKIDFPDGIFPDSIFDPADNEPRGTPDLEKLVRWAADQNETFAGHLRDAHGLKPQNSKPETDTDEEPSTVDIELRLREMSFVSQFEALRAAHLLAPGPERDRLLAVGYANLGMLTQHLWSPAWKVFAARSLIYAERATRSAPGEASSEVQAYAAAMAGLHAAALRHADAAGDQPSPRLQAISAYCRFRDDELVKLAEDAPEIRDLAEMLAFLVIEPTAQSHRIAERYAALIASNPDCFRLYDVVAAQELISLLHDVTLRGPSQLSQSIPARLRAVPDLPKSVQELVVADSVVPAELADRLEAELGPLDARPEPSWPVLGRLIRDEAMIQAHRRLDFLRSPLGVPAGEEYEAFRTFVGDHPYAVVLELLSDQPVTEEARQAIVAWIEFQKDVPRKGSLWFPMWNFGPRHESLLETVASQLQLDQQFYRTLFDFKRFADWIAEDLVVLLDDRHMKLVGGSFSALDAANALAEISPHHPFRAVTLMQQEGIAAEQWKQWEHDYADRPSLLVPLAAALLANEKFDDAARVAAKAAALEPSFEAFQTLADIHLAAGREDDYVTALEQAFEQPSFGLAATRSRVNLARRYMSRGEFEKAEPHAAAAAESYAAWAIDCAIDCYTGLKEWKTAEDWIVRRTERYGSAPLLWYLWCRQTGHGHIDAAEELAEAWAQSLEAPLEQMEEQTLYELGLFRLVADDDEAAGDLLAALSKRQQFAATGLIATAGYLRAGNVAAAKALLQECAGWQGDAAMRAGVFLKCLESGAPPDAETFREFDQAIKGFGENEQMLWRAVFGEIFVQLGARDAGLALLRQAVMPPQNVSFGGAGGFEQALAAVWLREHSAEDAAAAGSSKAPASKQEYAEEEPDA